MAFRRKFYIFIFICACQMSHLLASQVYLFSMVRGYYIYKDIWLAWLPCSESYSWIIHSIYYPWAYLSFATCCLRVNLPCCSVGFHFAYCSVLYFSQPHYCRKAEGCIAVRSPLGSGRYNVITSSGSSVQNLTFLKFQTVKKNSEFLS